VGIIGNEMVMLMTNLYSRLDQRGDQDIKTRLPELRINPKLCKSLTRSEPSEFEKLLLEGLAKPRDYVEKRSSERRGASTRHTGRGGKQGWSL
jgi:hypothetical protein